jgi:hypothetical protein
MFIYQPPLINELEQSLEDVKKEFGIMPVHWEFLASISPERFEMFITEIRYLLNHPNINGDFFAMLRLYVANKEEFSYCKSLNTKLLLAKGYDKNMLKSLKEDIATIPLDKRHQLLASKAMKAIYQPKDFLADDIDELKKISWSDRDIYDAIDHGAFLFKFSKILQVYSL